MGIIVGVFTIVGFIYAIWAKVKPRSRNYKLKRLYFLIEEWLDEIDKSTIDDLSPTILDNRENKIRSFIADNKLENIQMSFSLQFRQKFLSFCGIKAELCLDESLFQEYSRCPVEGLTIGIFWETLVGDFSKYQRQYKPNDPQANFADIKKRIKLLKMYAGAKAT